MAEKTHALLECSLSLFRGAVGTSYHERMDLGLRSHAPFFAPVKLAIRASSQGLPEGEAWILIAPRNLRRLIEECGAAHAEGGLAFATAFTSKADALSKFFELVDEFPYGELTLASLRGNGGMRSLVQRRPDPESVAALAGDSLLWCLAYDAESATMTVISTEHGVCGEFGCRFLAAVQGDCLE